MASEGTSGFYRGKTARKLVPSVLASEDVWSLQDLNQYQVILRKPMRFQYGSADFVTATLPLSRARHQVIEKVLTVSANLGDEFV
jgi:gamma-glutamyltranspeptidase/glutathione hydrolase